MESRRRITEESDEIPTARSMSDSERLMISARGPKDDSKGRSGSAAYDSHQDLFTYTPVQDNKIENEIIEEEHENEECDKSGLQQSPLKSSSDTDQNQGAMKKASTFIKLTNNEISITET